MAAGMISFGRKQPASGWVKARTTAGTARRGKRHENIERCDSDRRIRTAQTGEKTGRCRETDPNIGKRLATSSGLPNGNNGRLGDTVEALWICHAAAVYPRQITPP
jgi:hypothetical protein